jgi:hypothetical protein
VLFNLGEPAHGEARSAGKRRSLMSSLIRIQRWLAIAGETFSLERDLYAFSKVNCLTSGDLKNLITTANSAVCSKFIPASLT